MITVETSIEIRRPVEVVFAFATDFRNVPQWQKAMKEAHVTPDGLPAVGTRGRQVGSFLGVKLDATSEITALEPNRSLSFKASSGPASMEATWRFEAGGEGMRLSGTYQQDSAPPDFVRTKNATPPLRMVGHREGCHSSPSMTAPTCPLHLACSGLGPLEESLGGWPKTLSVWAYRETPA